MFHLSAAFLSVCLGYWNCKLFATETFQDTFFFCFVRHYVGWKYWWYLMQKFVYLLFKKWLCICCFKMKLHIYFGGESREISMLPWEDEHSNVRKKSPTLMWIPSGKPAFIVCNVLLGKILFMTSFNLYISALEIKKRQAAKVSCLALTGSFWEMSAPKTVKNNGPWHLKAPLHIIRKCMCKKDSK